MPKKIPPRNAFYFYMEHYKEQQRKKGITYPGGMKDVANACADLWKNLPPGERAVFEERARKEKQRMNIPEMKYTSTGQSYAEIEEEQRLKRQMQQMEREHIGSIIKKNTYANKLDTYMFYLMDVNCYCRTSNDQFVVAEFTITRFSLANGTIDFIHETINPGSIPIGYASDAKTACQTFGLDMPDPATYNPDKMKEVTSLLFDYLTPNGEEEIRPIFTLMDRVPMVTFFLQNLFQKYSYRKRSSSSSNSSSSSSSTTIEEIADKQLKVYRLDLLFYYLVNGIRSTEYEGFPKETIAAMELQKDRFAYIAKLACDHHESIPDKAHYCTQSRTKRWAFTIMDQCCPMLGIDLKAGIHVPEDFDVEDIAMVVAEKQERLKTTVALPLESQTNSVNTTLNDTIDSEQGRRNAWGGTADKYNVPTTAPSSSREYVALRRPGSRSVYNAPAAPSLEEDLDSSNWPSLSGGRGGRGRGRQLMN